MSARFAGLILVLVVVLVAAVSWAEMKKVRKVDNFTVCVDASGSMMSGYKGTGHSDLAEAKSLAKDMLGQVPDLGYKSGTYRFAPYEVLLPGEPFDRAHMADAVDTLPEQVDVWGNRTPLGDGLYELAWPISEMPGKTAVILFTDGGQNEGQDPVDVAKQLYEHYDVCLHIVSFAQTPSEQATVDALANIDSCSVVADAEGLADPDKMAVFVEKVFWEMRDVTPKKVVKTKPAPTYETVRMELLIEFDTAKWDIRPEYHGEVAKLGDFMNQYPETTAKVVGYADARGTYLYNLRLSQNRADSVRDYLVEHFGIASDRILPLGYGETRPKAPNTSPENMQLNRRVEAYVTGMIVRE